MSKTTHGFLCSPRIYEYEGWVFEFGQMGEPWPLNKTGEPAKRAGRTFYKMIDRFCEEPDREKFRAGGGCQRVQKGETT